MANMVHASSYGEFLRLFLISALQPTLTQSIKILYVTGLAEDERRDVIKWLETDACQCNFPSLHLTITRGGGYRRYYMLGWSTVVRALHLFIKFHLSGSSSHIILAQEL